MNYRKGTLDDIKDICVMIQEAIKNMESMEIYQWDDLYPTDEDFYDDIVSDTLYVAEDNKDMIAVYVISQKADEEYQNCEWSNPDNTACILHRLCVSPKYQNKGLGREILNHIEVQARTMRFQSIRLDVFTKNSYAMRLYQNNGYKERGFADWRKGRFLLMEKELV